MSRGWRSTGTPSRSSSATVPCRRCRGRRRRGPGAADRGEPGRASVGGDDQAGIVRRSAHRPDRSSAGDDDGSHCEATPFAGMIRIRFEGLPVLRTLSACALPCRFGSSSLARRLSSVERMSQTDAAPPAPEPRPRDRGRRRSRVTIRPQRFPTETRTAADAARHRLCGRPDREVARLRRRRRPVVVLVSGSDRLDAQRLAGRSPLTRYAAQLQTRLGRRPATRSAACRRSATRIACR